jgi:hypothetical protein
MSRKPKPAIPSEKVIRGLLDRYACPVPWHEVRTRFLGNLATPALSVSPMRIVQDLWGGELPTFDTLDEVNELIGALVNGLWNSLTKHQKRSEPFRLVRLIAEPTPQNLATLARTRRQELDGFIEGLFNGEDQMDLPERGHVAVGHLSEMRAMMAGIEELVARDAKSESRTELEATFKHLRELTRIMELEIHEAVLSCTRARKHMLEAFPTQKPTVH